MKSRLFIDQIASGTIAKSTRQDIELARDQSPGMKAICNPLCRRPGKLGPPKCQSKAFDFIKISVEGTLLSVPFFAPFR